MQGKDREKDEWVQAFLEKIRHEINTPLAVIKGYTELIEESLGVDTDPEIRKFLHIIKDNVERLEESTDSVMTMEGLLEVVKEN